MEVLRYSSNAWGQTVLEGASWDLLPIFFGVGVLVIFCHAMFKLVRKQDDQ
jgi:hypothetical protein